MEKEANMNKVEKYLMKQIEKQEREIACLNGIINRYQHWETQYLNEQRFINIVSEKATIKSFESSDGTIKKYIQLGDVNDYGSDQPDFNFVVDLLGIDKYEDPDGAVHNYYCNCNCEECFEEGDEEDAE